MNTLVWALVIFFSRILDVSLGTIRVKLIVRHQKFIAALIGFIEVLIFILVVSKVIRDVGNLLNVIAYAAGFATGTIVGITISERLGRPIYTVNIISREKWQEIEQALRDAGFGVTRLPGFGREGTVAMLSVVVKGENIPKLKTIVESHDPKAFLFTHSVEDIKGGFVYGVKSKI
ncbi:MAG: hypothetical protein DRQ10_08335 [Candidatus Hydrothermota bacterium]|nr:MAG: hypothetical protein DRQ10_08335 [Candidatus Hydrothermae bacterium]